MLEPILVAVDLAAHRREVGLLDAAGYGARLADLAVVDRAHGNDLGGSAGEERLLDGVEVAPEQVGLRDLVAQVARDRDHRVARDAFEGARAGGRREQLAAFHHERVLVGGLAYESMERRENGLLDNSYH